MQHHRAQTPSVAIVIPVYKAFMTDTEALAFRQCLRVLRRYPIHLATFAGLNLSAYREHSGDLQVEIFGRDYFSGIPGYNRLMMSYDFYDRFKEYQYILLYQLDAYVFRDELAEWCLKGYDYIGAPWFTMCDGHLTRDFFKTGNGGLSLRHVPHFLRMLKTANRFKLLRDYFRLRLWDKLGRLFHLLSQLVSPHFTPHFADEYEQYEDLFWSVSLNRKIKKSFKGSWYRKYVPQWLYPQLRIAPVEEALRFSFERQPSYLYQLNQQQLPFGCHAWETYEPQFWARFISMNQHNETRVDEHGNT